MARHWLQNKGRVSLPVSLPSPSFTQSPGASFQLFCYPRAPYFLCLQACVCCPPPTLLFSAQKLLHNILGEQLNTAPAVMASPESRRLPSKQSICTNPYHQPPASGTFPQQMHGFHPNAERSFWRTGGAGCTGFPAEQLDEVKSDDEMQLIHDYASYVQSRQDSLREFNIAHPPRTLPRPERPWFVQTKSKGISACCS